ncbi:MAG: ABC transporter substrate-binding protein [Alphaproteobacteria bacterium]|jgi:phospholipid transport system substrate-binding protein|nr:ABC transporter substrate-binding protein [Alphaproteobacteria bacterium]
MVGRRSILVAAALLTIGLTVGAPAFGAGSGKADVKVAGFIKDLADRAIVQLTPKDISEFERARRMRVLLEDGFDMDAIGKFVLGVYWRRATEAQQAEFLALYRELVVRNYAALFGNYTGESVEIGPIRPLDDKDEAFMVESQINRAGGPPIPIVWRVRNNAAAPKILDVQVEGVSMPITHRNEYSAVIQRTGGNLDPLLSALRKKTERPLSTDVPAAGEKAAAGQ